MVSNFYYYFKSALTGEECDAIIDLGQYLIKENKSKGFPTTAVTGGRAEKNLDNKPSIKEKTMSDIFNEGKTKNDYYVRDSEISWIAYEEKWVYDLIIPFVRKANNLTGWNFDIDAHEHAQYTNYYAPGGLYGWHKDGSGDQAAVWRRHIEGITPRDAKGDVQYPYCLHEHLIGKVRKLSMTINLTNSDDYKGGNLKFDFGEHTEGKRFHECTEIRERGSIVIFPSFLPHCVTPVTEGTRTSLVLWANGSPFK